MKIINASDLKLYIMRHLFIDEDSTTEEIECQILRAIDVQPAIDVTSVRHGQWETNSDRPDTLICSVCKCGFDMWKHDPHNFCPNCGAKMDEEKSK